MTAVEKFDALADLVATGSGVTGADVAAAADGDKEKYFRLEAWLASKGYRPIVVGAKVTYVPKTTGRIGKK